MSKKCLKPDRKTCVRWLVRILVSIAGAAIYAVGFQFFLYPNSVVSGGVVGISMLVNHFTGWPVGVLTIMFNIPLFAIAWRHFGLDFIISSAIGMLACSGFVDIFAMADIALTNDPMLASIIGGVIKGVGLGMIYYVGATAGGIDIVAKMLRRKFPFINYGTLVMCIDAVIVISYALILQRYESAMYAVIAMFVVTKMIDLALYGFDNSSLCYIISDKCADMAKIIISGQIRRGVTILEGEGAYSHKKKQVIMCVIKRTQIGELKRIVKSVDDCAFVIVSDAKNVFGNGFESISEVK